MNIHDTVQISIIHHALIFFVHLRLALLQVLCTVLVASITTFNNQKSIIIIFFSGEKTEKSRSRIEKRTERYRYMNGSAVTACVPLVNHLELQLRFLSPSDIDCVKGLCRSWFPIEYPDTWFQEITSNSRFYSLAATYQVILISN